MKSGVLFIDENRSVAVMPGNRFTGIHGDGNGWIATAENRDDCQGNGEEEKNDDECFHVKTPPGIAEGALERLSNSFSLLFQGTLE